MPIDLSTAGYQKTLREEAFILSEISTVVDGGTFNLHLKNPSTNDTNYVLLDISISSTGSYTANIHDGFSSAPSGGTSIDAHNLFLDSGSGSDPPDSGSGVTNKDVTFTASSTHAVGVGGSSGPSGSSVVGGLVSHPMMVMQTDREIVVEVTNTSGVSSEYTISITYFETTFDPTD